MDRLEGNQQIENGGHVHQPPRNHRTVPKSAATKAPVTGRVSCNNGKINMPSSRHGAGVCLICAEVALPFLALMQ